MSNDGRLSASGTIPDTKSNAQLYGDGEPALSITLEAIDQIDEDGWNTLTFFEALGIVITEGAIPCVWDHAETAIENNQPPNFIGIEVLKPQNSFRIGKCGKQYRGLDSTLW